MSVARRLCGLIVLTALTAAGSVLAQQPVLNDVRPDEVRNLAGRLKQLDPGVGPAGQDLAVWKSMIEGLRKANPSKSDKQIADDLMKQMGLDPSQLKPLLDLVQKQPFPIGPGGRPSSPQPPRGIDRLTPPAQSPTPTPVPAPAPAGGGTQRGRGRSAPSVAAPLPDLSDPPGRVIPSVDPAVPLTPSGVPAEPNPSVPPGVSADQQQQYKAVAKWWEKNVGPLNDTPAVRNMLMDMITSGSQAGGTANGPLGDLFQSAAKSYSGSDVAGLMPDSLPSFSGWQPPRVNAGDWSVGAGRSGLSSGGGGMPSFGGGGGSWLPVVLFVAVAGVGLLLLWLWPRLTGATSDRPTPVAGLGPWPVDPRSITDREGLVRAFEYLSVLVNGGTARTWNHRTTADGFRRNVPGAAAGADELAEAYALARYTPAGQPLPADVVAAARGHLCQIAGLVPT